MNAQDINTLFTNQANTRKVTAMKDFDEDTMLGYFDEIYDKLNLKVCEKCYSTINIKTGKRFRPDYFCEMFEEVCTEQCV